MVGCWSADQGPLARLIAANAVSNAEAAVLLASTGAAPTANANGTRVNIKGSGLLSGDVALDSITLAGTATVEVSATDELVAVTAQASGQTADGGVVLL